MHPLKTVLVTAVVVTTTVGGAYVLGTVSAVGTANAGDDAGSTATNPSDQMVTAHAAGAPSRGAGARADRAPRARPTSDAPHPGNGHHYGQDPGHTNNGHHYGHGPHHTNNGHTNNGHTNNGHTNNGHGPPHGR